MHFKHLAFKLIDSIADVIYEHLTWDRIGKLNLPRV